MRIQQALFFALSSAALVLVMTTPARADFDSDEAFAQQVRTNPVTCHDLDSCRKAGLELVTLFDGAAATPEVAAALPRLQLIAEDQATIWADTILEGGYEAEGATVLDRVEGISKNGHIVSYRITYSEKAWRLAEDGEKTVEGRIEEASFVSKSLKSWLRDELSLAAFK